MGHLFYNLGRMVGPKLRKGKWVWDSLTGSESDAIAAEYAVGCDVAAEVRCQVQPCTEREIRELLKEVGSRLSLCVANKLRRFSFEAVQSEKANAFALPGGFIFVTDSLIELCERERDEIAFILAHEMAHVIRGHAMERIVSDSVFRTLSKKAMVKGAVGAWIKKVGVEFLVSAYSQSRESEADELGFQLMRTAGFKEDAAEKVLRRLAEAGGQDGQKGPGGYFSTHPDVSVRIGDIRRVGG